MRMIFNKIIPFMLKKIVDIFLQKKKWCGGTKWFIEWTREYRDEMSQIITGSKSAVRQKAKRVRSKKSKKMFRNSKLPRILLCKRVGGTSITRVIVLNASEDNLSKFEKQNEDGLNTRQAKKGIAVKIRYRNGSEKRKQMSCVIDGLCSITNTIRVNAKLMQMTTKQAGHLQKIVTTC